MPKPKPPTISRDPYAQDPYAFIGTSAVEEKKEPPKPREQETPGPKDKPATEKITVPFPADLIERARDAAYWERVTLSGIVVQALADALARMERERGEPYPRRAGELRGGRPIGSGKARNA